MARDYSKPGNTPPGTKHARPERVARKTWLDFVKPDSGFTLKEAPKLPEVVPFTRLVDGELVTKDEPFAKVVAGARKSRRIAAANRARRQRKGQRAFDRQQMEQARERDTVLALVRVADGQVEATPAARENATFGLQRRMEKLQGAQ